MTTNSLAVCALAGAASVVVAAGARAQQVEIRVVEMDGQTQASPSDAVLNYAVQIRGNGSGVALWALNSITLLGEAESWSTFTRLQISEIDGTYYTGPHTMNNLVGRGGLARSYSYLAGIDANFNGRFNLSAGPYTDTPNNEIGLVYGTAGGGQLMGTPGVDTDLDGRPDSVPTGTMGALSPAIMQQYFAQDAYIDIYRFQVTVTDFSLRTVPVDLTGATARIFDLVQLNDETWGPVVPLTDATLGVTNTSFEVVPSPASAVLLGLGMLAIRRRRS